MRAKKEKSKEYYKNTNVPLFAVDEKVSLNDEKIRRGKKMSPPYICPYEIISVDVNITLQLPRMFTPID